MTKLIDRLKRRIELHPPANGRGGDNYENGVHDGLQMALKGIEEDIRKDLTNKPLQWSIMGSYWPQGII